MNSKKIIASIVLIALILPIGYILYQRVLQEQSNPNGDGENSNGTGDGTDTGNNNTQTDPQILWIDSLPDIYRNSILWAADHEEGTLYDWDFGNQPMAGGGIFNTGTSAEVSATISNNVKHSGNYSIKTTITNAIRAENGNKAVRLMRWTDKAWDLNGTYFPIDCYFSTWFYFPELYNSNKYPPWDPGDGGWWNVFQIKSDDSEGESQPTWVLNVAFNETDSKMYFYFYSKYNSPNGFSLLRYFPIPMSSWFHVEARVKQSSTNSGIIQLWINGVLMFDLQNIKTILSGPVIWGIGNYTDHVQAVNSTTPIGTASIYFDDCAVSSKRLSESFQ